MKRRFLAGLVAAASVTASILTASGAAAATPDETAAGTQSVAPNGTQLDAIKVDDTKFKIVATLRGVGKQIYDCKDGVLAFREPAAGLFTSRGVPAAIHGKGPFWTNFDGSRVDGSPTTPPSSVSPDPKSIPWLKLIGTPTANTTGVFSNVAFIQRIDTRGGLAPAGTCTAPKTVAVDYVANYVFWAPK